MSRHAGSEELCVVLGVLEREEGFCKGLFLVLERDVSISFFGAMRWWLVGDVCLVLSCPVLSCVLLSDRRRRERTKADLLTLYPECGPYKQGV